MCYDLSRKEVKDRTDIEIFMIDFKAGHITDPDTIRLVHLELPLKDILLFGKAGQSTYSEILPIS